MTASDAPTAPSSSFSAWIYFLLAFGITWGAVLILALPHGFPGQGEAIMQVYPLVFLAMIAGPAIAGIVMALATGTIGDLLRAIATWRVGPGYYAVSILAVPAAIAVSLGIASLFAPGFTPLAFGEAGLTVVAMGIGLGLLAGLLEEIGWTGFATPRQLARWSVLATGLMIGAVHGIWHLPAGFWGEGARYGWMYLPYFVLLWIAGLIALRLIIVWLFARTGSVLLAQLAHASYTGGLLALWPATEDLVAITWWSGGFALLLLIVALSLVLLVPVRQTPA